MTRVKRIEAQGVLSELKSFAFEGNEDFRNGLLRGVEIDKTFYHPAEPEIDEYGSVFYPLKKTTLSFTANRPAEHVRSHPVYVYSLAAAVEQTIRYIPHHIFNQFDDETQDTLEEIDAGDLSETLSVTYSTSSYEFGEIEETYAYELHHQGARIFLSNEEDFFYDGDGDYVDTPLIESDDYTGATFIPTPIEQDQLPDIGDRVLNDMAFRAIVAPFHEDAMLPVMRFRDNVGRMRAIMDNMRTGRGVAKLDI